MKIAPCTKEVEENDTVSTEYPSTMETKTIAFSSCQTRNQHKTLYQNPEPDTKHSKYPL